MPASRPERDRRAIAAVAYLLGPVTGLACVLLYRDDAYIRFHGWQSLLASAFVAAAWAALDAIPLLGLGMLLGLFLGASLLFVLLVWQALAGRWFLLPLLGDVALELARHGGGAEELDGGRT